MPNPDDGRWGNVTPCSYDESYRLAGMFLPETTDRPKLVRSYLETLVNWNQFTPKEFSTIAITKTLQSDRVSSSLWYPKWGQPIPPSGIFTHLDRKQSSWGFFNAFTCEAIVHTMSLLRKPSINNEGEPMVFKGYKLDYQGPPEFTNGSTPATMIVRKGDQTTTFDNGTKIIPYPEWRGMELWGVSCVVIIGTPKVEIAARVDCGEEKSTLHFSAKVTGDYEVHHYIT